jgi:hypothetical protein
LIRTRAGAGWGERGEIEIVAGYDLDCSASTPQATVQAATQTSERHVLGFPSHFRPLGKARAPPRLQRAVVRLREVPDTIEMIDDRLIVKFANGETDSLSV